MADNKGILLPAYVMADESYSMTPHRQALAEGMVSLHESLRSEPMIAAKVRLAVLGFSKDVAVRLPLTDVRTEMRLPELVIRTETSYAAAFQDLLARIPADVRALKADSYQVHRPVVFFLSDGQPTDKSDKWRARLDELKDSGFRERPNVLAFGVGDADPTVIRDLATSPRYGFMMTSGASTAGAIAEFAASMLNSMVASAERLDRGEQTIEFEKPEGFVQLDAPLL
jgi:uncharacterized protein YegL